MEEKISKELENKITEYVYKNYSSYNKKDLIIKEKDSHFAIFRHPDEGPLVLGKNII